MPAARTGVIILPKQTRLKWEPNRNPSAHRSATFFRAMRQCSFQKWEANMQRLERLLPLYRTFDLVLGQFNTKEV